MASTPSLDGVWAKVARAKSHAADLQRLMEDALRPDRYRFAFDSELQDGLYVYRVYGVPEIDPTWQLIAGDCLHNLRSALDHLAWQLVLLDGGSPDKETYFPIRELPFNKKGPLGSVNLKPAIQGVDILEALEQAQPYAGLDGSLIDPHDNYLWGLNVLNNIDKHRLLLVVVLVPNINDIWWGSNEGDPNPLVRVNLSPLRDGDPIAFFDFHGLERPRGFKPNAGVQVILHEKDARLFSHMSLGDAVRGLISAVEWGIIHRLFLRFFH